MFPIIQHINDVLPHIEDCNDFVVAERDGYTIINYVVESADTFPPLGAIKAAIRRECRGITFCSETGKIIRRPLSKFFNISQREDSMPDKIDLSRPHIIMDKKDGSLICPFIVNDEIIWGTKMAAQDFHEAVSEFVADKPEFVESVRSLLRNNYSPIYEWIGPNNVIVLKYPKTELRLLAIRHIHTGEYLPMDHEFVTDIHNPCDYWGPKWQTAHEMIEAVRPMTGIEGFVIRFDNGEMYKAKVEEYVLMHKAKEKILFDRHVIEMHYANLLDDVLPYLTDDERESIVMFVTEFTNAMNRLLQQVYTLKDYMDGENYSKRDYAMNSDQSSPLRPIIFSMYDGKDAYDTIRTLLDKNIGSNVNFETFCDRYLGGVRRNK